MMRTIKVIIIAILMVIPILGYAQQNSSASSPLAYLEKTFPKLTNLYREELSKYPAHYIFAIDVSGTMNQYEDMVVNSIVPFFSALPDGDRVDIIPFGTEALSPMSYSGIIDSQIRNTLCQNIGRLYNDPSYPDGFKGYTNIQGAIEELSKVLQKNREYRVNVIVVLTDFRNDVKGDKPSEHKFTEEQLN